MPGSPMGLLKNEDGLVKNPTETAHECESSLVLCDSLKLGRLGLRKCEEAHETRLRVSHPVSLSLSCLDVFQIALPIWRQFRYHEHMVAVPTFIK